MYLFVLHFYQFMKLKYKEPNWSLEQIATLEYLQLEYKIHDVEIYCTNLYCNEKIVLVNLE